VSYTANVFIDHGKYFVNGYEVSEDEFGVMANNVMDHVEAASHENLSFAISVEID
jgi:hypothetical protein